MGKLLAAPPTITLERGLNHDASACDCAGVYHARETSSGRVGRAHPNGQASRGDGARGYRVNPPPLKDGVSSYLT